MNGAQPRSVSRFPSLTRMLLRPAPPVGIHQITGLLQKLARKSSSGKEPRWI